VKNFKPSSSWGIFISLNKSNKEKAFAVGYLEAFSSYPGLMYVLQLKGKIFFNSLMRRNIFFRKNDNSLMQIVIMKTSVGVLDYCLLSNRPIVLHNWLSCLLCNRLYYLLPNQLYCLLHNWLYCLPSSAPVGEIGSANPN
jgi:hypothetical protein